MGNGQRLDVIGNEGIHDREIRIAVRNGRVTDRRTVVNRAPVWGAESDINGSLRAYANALRERLLGTEPGPQGVRLTLRVDVDGQVELLRQSPQSPFTAAQIEQALRSLPPFTPGLNRGALPYTISFSLRRPPR